MLVKHLLYKDNWCWLAGVKNQPWLISIIGMESLGKYFHRVSVQKLWYRLGLCCISAWKLNLAMCNSLPIVLILKTWRGYGDHLKLGTRICQERPLKNIQTQLHWRPRIEEVMERNWGLAQWELRRGHLWMYSLSCSGKLSLLETPGPRMTIKDVGSCGVSLVWATRTGCVCRCQSWRNVVAQGLWSQKIMSESQIQDTELSDLIYTAGCWVLLWHNSNCVLLLPS